MNCKKLVVVGDKFNEFANGKDVLTISQLELLTQIPANIIDKEHEIIIGQGVRKDFAGKVISNHARNAIHGNKLKMYSLEKMVNDKKNVHCHKRLEQNVLIGSAEQTDHNSNLYAMPLLIDERCELMSDHQTGQHIQGMLLVEASRQAFIAITEEFIYKQDSGRYYVINSMAINFSSFLFPLPALVHFEFLEQDINNHRGRFKAQVRVTQHQTLCASMDVEFTVYPSGLISEKEKSLAEAAMQAAVVEQQTPAQEMIHA
ncbi:AfsA-related hotdog domain-containing protein [Erwinia pyri]|uniref:AfsA-related hotdog domain-containing protein n=1 Tax=Erwinia pyri TaxID=3062598 RepID=A0AA50DJ58_9GAMM|nr:AfsA-related hotdog domain-containing protein [Erwinia sp. DE2]WLS79019.1 AfsA-related hotdog domain-containing protein [Erwinia sp. DE2]